jgi:transposase
VPEDSINAALGREEEIFRDELFADAYVQVGQPSKSPALLCKVLILQFLDNCSDREAEERARYDLRWKKALGVGLAEAGFDYSTLSKFRTRLLLFKKERVVFEAILQQAAAKGLLSQKQVTQIMGSTFTLVGAAAVQNTYTLIRTAIRKLLQSLIRKNNFNTQMLTGLKLNYQTRKKPTLDWSNPEEREAHFHNLIADAQLVLAVTAALPLTETEQKLRDILRRATFYDIEP